MSVLGYLDSLSSEARLKEEELTSIRTSILYLKSNLNNYFKDELKESFQFGSSKRDTILPRKMDENSDIDYMIVFKDESLKPQTYLNKLKAFAEKYYQKSEIHQSSPTVVLELNHIKFDLVPAIDKGYGDYHSYYIPAKASDINNWISTNPNDFCERLVALNINYNYKLKPMIRLMKYWNALNSHPFDSYKLEEHICQCPYTGINSIKDFLFKYISYFDASSDSPQWVKDKVNRAKTIISKVKEYENKNMPFYAESEIKKLLPEVN